MVGADDTYSGNDDVEPGNWADGLRMTLSFIGPSNCPDGHIGPIPVND